MSVESSVFGKSHQNRLGPLTPPSPKSVPTFSHSCFVLMCSGFCSFYRLFFYTIFWLYVSFYHFPSFFIIGLRWLLRASVHASRRRYKYCVQIGVNHVGLGDTLPINLGWVTPVQIFSWIMSLLCCNSTTNSALDHTAVRKCCKGDHASQCKRPKFDPSPR